MEKVHDNVLPSVFSTLSHIEIQHVENSQSFLVTPPKAVNLLYQTVDIISSGKVTKDKKNRR